MVLDGFLSYRCHSPDPVTRAEDCPLITGWNGTGEPDPLRWPEP